MESIITLLIYIHAFFGGIGLISGIISVSVKKGATNHKRAGKIFSYAMLTSSVIALVISNMPQHHNVFLFLIGLFTIYLVLAGNRALTLHHKIKRKADWKDQAISGSMFLISLFMLMLGLLGRQYHFENSILYIFFGGFGVFLTLKDFQTFKRFTKKKNAGLMNHIGRMVGALIASITAFLVAGLHIGTIMVWITPTLIGTAYIIYANKKYNKLKIQTELS